jgi:hypothetical protein
MTRAPISPFLVAQWDLPLQSPVRLRGFVGSGFIFFNATSPINVVQSRKIGSTSPGGLFQQDE